MPTPENKTLGLLEQIRRAAEANSPPASLYERARQINEVVNDLQPKGTFPSLFSELEQLRRQQAELEKIVLGPTEALQKALALIREQALAAAILAKTTKDIEDLRISILGKTGLLNTSKFLKQVPKSEASEKGKILAETRLSFSEFLEQQARNRAEKELSARLATERIDVTLPGRRADIGGVHPLTRALDRIVDIFARFGYDVAEGPEIEDDWHNFEALNFPPDHPARAMHDTFYFGDGRLLRTHTSPVQIRAMKDRRPPIRLIAPGKVYRSDSDQTHSPMFHQVEGLLVGESVTMADLKGTLAAFLRGFFERDFEMRFKPTYFPFVEPGADVVIRWQLPDGSNRWLEVLGCGMVHPKVLENCGIDPERYTGFAFGMGVERLAMLRYGVTDLRAFFENDVRFLRQFN